MILSLAFLPPVEVLEDVVRHLDLAAAPDGQLEVLPKAELQLSVTMLGNVSKPYVARLVTLVTTASTEWPMVPTVRLAGGAALEGPGDSSLWAKLDGDVDALKAVAKSIAPAVDRLGFAVDRRRFQPRLELARITASTQLALLQRLLDRLDAYAGPPWQVGQLSLVRTTFDAGRHGGNGYEVLHEFPLPSS
jgi:2'-5' RNA ligase